MKVKKYVKAISRRSIALSKHLRFLVKFKLSTPKNANKETIIANMLVVKDLRYVKIAKICVQSFLHFHPNSRIVVHADSRTFLKSQKKLSSKKVKVIRDQNDSDPWQISKLNLVSQLSGSHEIFMDADLRWNGPIKKITKPTFFVREFTFNEQEKYSVVFAELNWEKYLNYSMKNTSFVSFGGVSFPKKTWDEILQNILSFQQKVNESKLSQDVKVDLIRISEQVALSLVLDDFECNFLKASDSQFDGLLVESSYVGATGTRFGLFGATNR
jgi:hypothetical protein